MPAERIALVADTFSPLRTSGAVQLRDLARELAAQGVDLTVMVPAADLGSGWRLDEQEGFRVARLRSPRTKDVSYLRRTVAELLMPFAMARNIRKSPIAANRYDGIVWYSPSIFHGPLVQRLKQESCCPSYLILRDIFPQWALEMGKLRPGPLFDFFNSIAVRQYALADVIGVQSPANVPVLSSIDQRCATRTEVLSNWLGPAGARKAALRMVDTRLAGRTILVYAGNMGVAQNMDLLIELAESYRSDPSVGMLLVGRGSEVPRLTASVRQRELDNILFHDEIEPDEIPDIYGQCHIGLVALDPRHRSHNIPGKFVSYLQSGLPVLAAVNPGNDLARLIRQHNVGEVIEQSTLVDLRAACDRLIASVRSGEDYLGRNRKLFDSQFSVTAAASQIRHSLAAARLSHVRYGGSGNSWPDG